MADLLSIVLLALHLIAINVAVGGPLVCLWLEWQARGRRDELAASAADCLARWSLLALLAGSLLGLALGTLLWTDSYRQLWLERLWHKASWGIAEFGTSLAAAIVYWLWRIWQPKAGSIAAAGRIVLLLFTATNLLYHFPPLFLVAARFSDAGQSAGEPVTPALFRQEMVRGEVVPLSVHFALASVAMAGTMLLGLALAQKRRGGNDEDYARLARWGGRSALVPTLLQLPVGLWVLNSLSAVMQNRLLGGNVLATLCFALSIGAALWLMRELAAIALGEHERSQLVRSMVLITLVVVLMTAAQRLARSRPPSAAAEVRASGASPLVCKSMGISA